MNFVAQSAPGERTELSNEPEQLRPTGSNVFQMVVTTLSFLTDPRYALLSKEQRGRLRYHRSAIARCLCPRDNC
jgi:hypothetical protein